MTFRRPGSLLVAAFAGSAASAVNEAAKKTRLVPVLKLMTKASTVGLAPKHSKRLFHSTDIMPHTVTLIWFPYRNLRSGKRRAAASTALRNRKAIVIGADPAQSWPTDDFNRTALRPAHQSSDRCPSWFRWLRR